MFRYEIHDTIALTDSIYTVHFHTALDIDYALYVNLDLEANNCASKKVSQFLR